MISLWYCPKHICNKFEIAHVKSAYELAFQNGIVVLNNSRIAYLFNSMVRFDVHHKFVCSWKKKTQICRKQFFVRFYFYGIELNKRVVEKSLQKIKNLIRILPALEFQHYYAAVFQSTKIRLRWHNYFYSTLQMFTVRVSNINEPLRIHMIEINSTSPKDSLFVVMQ